MLVYKGEFQGRCYRSECDNSFATWRSRHTGKHYCSLCAEILNETKVNREDALRLYNTPNMYYPSIRPDGYALYVGMKFPTLLGTAYSKVTSFNQFCDTLESRKSPDVIEVDYTCPFIEELLDLLIDKQTDPTFVGESVLTILLNFSLSNTFRVNLSNIYVNQPRGYVEHISLTELKKRYLELTT